jgi:hypothetical protein
MSLSPKMIGMNRMIISGKVRVAGFEHAPNDQTPGAAVRCCNISSARLPSVMPIQRMKPIR